MLLSAIFKRSMKTFDLEKFLNDLQEQLQNIAVLNDLQEQLQNIAVSKLTTSVSNDSSCLTHTFEKFSTSMHLYVQCLEEKSV